MNEKYVSAATGKPTTCLLFSSHSSGKTGGFPRSSSRSHRCSSASTPWCSLNPGPLVVVSGVPVVGVLLTLVSLVTPLPLTLVSLAPDPSTNPFTLKPGLSWLQPIEATHTHQPKGVAAVRSLHIDLVTYHRPRAGEPPAGLRNASQQPPSAPSSRAHFPSRPGNFPARTRFVAVSAARPASHTPDLAEVYLPARTRPSPTRSTPRSR